MDLKTNNQYQEGVWNAKGVIPLIDKTSYETLEGAVLAKTAMIDGFEGQLGFSRDMEDINGDYARNLGMLDAFTEAYDEQIKTEGHDPEQEEE